MRVELWHLLVFSAAIFFIGLFGVLVRRNVVIVLMCIELMLNAVNLTFVSFSIRTGDLSGHVVVFFTISVAAAEVAVGLALVIALFRTLRSIDSEDVRMLKE
jgi:NADH-quinone oxidoreductase subunit K